MCDGAPAGANDLEEGVRVGSIQLELSGELGEEENLDRCPCTIPPCTSRAMRIKQMQNKSGLDIQGPEIPYLYATALD